MARDAGREGRWLGIELRRLLERAGHRCEKEAELLEPRWRDDPAVLLAVLGGQVRAATDHAAGPDLAEREARLGRRAKALAARTRCSARSPASFRFSRYGA